MRSFVSFRRTPRCNSKRCCWLPAGPRRMLDLPFPEFPRLPHLQIFLPLSLLLFRSRTRSHLLRIALLAQGQITCLHRHFVWDLPAREVLRCSRCCRSSRFAAGLSRLLFLLFFLGLAMVDRALGRIRCPGCLARAKVSRDSPSSPTFRTSRRSLLSFFAPDTAAIRSPCLTVLCRSSL